ncbi:hypothetical protein TTHERM_00494849 (macronuclear) [Tetrahymena thermophila SB210]|uniref:Uncharacterized protein n=1 Tax=Tetrahymena thermophila (strain SB210) TaxID=312017 RepID=A4VD25_TETTS|nr:hypothetical protein TTHERM_00494849 [Tetrahymena thermophila SB210]EDK31435.2 hypothetical protein TTHERM_00494849 [Tetrahymena thermophila SB210]|eukprot:XP_001470985.2 hypothetical protein TTHERM_00494849 [Tetrahymena thermophila SB210]
MSKKFLSKTNLNYAIDVQLGLENPLNRFKEINDSQKEEYEKEFQEFYENDLKTGFYIHQDQEDDEDEEKDANQDNEDNQVEKELVQFYNYNLQNEWWHIDEENNNQIVLFNSNGNVIPQLDQSKAKDFFKLIQQQNMIKLLQEFYKKYDYVLIMIYSSKKGSDQILDTISSKISKSSKSQVSSKKTHYTQIDEEKTDFKRISIFVSKFDFTDDEESMKNKAYTFDELEKLLKEYEKNNDVLIFPVIVKEEIKDIIVEDFDEKLAEKIYSYCQQHRYECLYDSESENEANQDDDDDEEEEEGAEESSDEEDSKPQDIYVQKTE